MSDDEQREAVALRDYLDQRFADFNRLVDERFRSLDTATTLAREEYRREVTHLNALRKSVETDRQEFVTKGDYQSRHDIIRSEIERLKLEQAKSESRGRTWTAAITLFLTVIIVISHFIR